MPDQAMPVGVVGRWVSAPGVAVGVAVAVAVGVAVGVALGVGVGVGVGVPLQVSFVIPARLNAGVLHDSTLLVKRPSTVTAAS